MCARANEHPEGLHRKLAQDGWNLSLFTVRGAKVPRSHIYSGSTVLGFALCQLSKHANCFRMLSGETSCVVKKQSKCTNTGYHFKVGAKSYRSYTRGCQGGTIRTVGPGVMKANTGLGAYIHMQGRSTCTYENHGTECKIPPNAPQFMIDMEGKFCEEATLIF